MSGPYKPTPLSTGESPPSFAAHIGLTPRHALAARRQAERNESVGAFEKAVEHWTIALTIEPNTPAAWRGLARALRALERNDEANATDRAETLVARSLS